MRKVLLIFCFSISLLIHPVATTGASEPAGVTMAAQPAFGGRFKYGEWLPVFVDVENTGPDLSGEIRVSMKNQTGRLDFIIPAELPSGARKRFTLYILPNNFSHSALVELVQAEETLLTSEIKLSVVPNDRYLLGIVAAEAAGMTAIIPPRLPGRRETAELVTFSVEEIPDRAEGLQLLNALVLNDIDSTLLTPAQRTALINWVAGGGQLVLGGGVGAQRTLAGLPPELQPVTLADLREVTGLPALQTYVDEPIRVPGPFILAEALPVSKATVLLAQTPEPAANTTSDSDGALPLVVEMAVGQGYVDFVALDLSQSPFDAWAGATDFAEQLLSVSAAWSSDMPPDISPRQMRDTQMSYALTNLPGLDLPSVRFLGLLLAGYIILVGPVNYFLLRWRDRLAWAWVTIPAFTLAFSFLAYGLGLNLRGTDIIINQLSVIKLGSDGQAAQGRTYVGIFSPKREVYDIEVSEKTLIRPLGEGGYDPWIETVNTPGVMAVVQSEPTRIRGLNVNQWSMQSFVADTMPAASLSLAARLTTDRQRLQGQLVNQGEQTWQDVIVIFNNRFQKLGDLAPGQAVDVNLALTDILESESMWFSSHMLFEDEFNSPTGPNREINFKQTVLDSTVFHGNDNLEGPIVIAWLADSPLQIQLDGKRVSAQKTSLVYGVLPLDFGDKQVQLPPGFSQTETLSLDGDTGPCDYGVGLHGYHLLQGTVKTELSLPPEVRNIQPHQLDLYIQPEGEWMALPAVELYDQLEQEWVFLDGVKYGPNPIQEPARFYNPASASMQIRLSTNNNTFEGGCIFLDLAMEGER
jgi:hypothetical protein